MTREPLGMETNGVATMPAGVTDPDLEQVSRIIDRELAAYHRSLSPILSHLDGYRGKQLRPKLLLLTARACGDVRPAHHTLAAAIEMIHTATLVHDDVLDEAEIRRHRATVNAAWGNEVSILLGDLLFSKAFQLASTVGDASACETIGSATNRVCAGEMLQSCRRGEPDTDEQTYFEIIEGKTAALTECACLLGARYAGADEETVARMAAFGRALGMAFQIADDVLDLVGDEATVGKTLGTDLAQGKMTLPVIRMRAAGCDMEEAIGYARDRADELAAEARGKLDCLPNGEARRVLGSLASWAVRREM